MITLQEIELLAGLLKRAGVNQYEAIWANGIMDRLRAEAAKAELKKQEDAQGSPTRT